MKKTSSTSVLVSTGSGQTYTLEDEDDGKPPTLEEISKPVPSTSRDRKYDFSPRGKNLPTFKVIIPPAASTPGSNDSTYKPPPAPLPHSSSSSGYASGRSTPSTLLAHQYYSSQMRKEHETNPATPEESNANLPSNSSLGFGVTSEDWSKRDTELIKTLNVSNNNNSMIAYPAKLHKIPKSALKVAASKDKQEASKKNEKSPPAASTSAVVQNTTPPPKSPPKKNKAATTSLPTVKKGSPKEILAGDVTFDKQVDDMIHAGAGHMDAKQKKKLRQQVLSKAVIRPKNEDEVEEENDDFPPPPPPEYADDDANATAKGKKRGSNASQNSHKSTGPTIEDDRTAGKARKGSLGANSREGSVSAKSKRDSVGSNKSKAPSVEKAESIAGEKPDSRKNSSASQTPPFSPPPSPPPAFKDDPEEKSSAGSDKGFAFSGKGNSLPRTPPETQTNSKESVPPPLTPPPEPENQPPPASQGEERDLTLPVCNCNNATLVQAKLIECFQTQPRNPCCCPSSGPQCGRSSNIQRSGRCSCCSSCRQPSPCFTPCSCQRCRVYHYCFNVLNRHTLRPEDMFIGISSYEQKVSNALRRQCKQNSGKCNCPTSHIITNSSENGEVDKEKTDDMENRTGAKNWPSPPEGYQDSPKEVNGGQDGMMAPGRMSGGPCRETSGMINPWQTEYSAQFKDFSDQIRKSSSRYPSYDEGYGGRFGGGCCGGGGQPGRQMRQGNCFEDGRERGNGLSGSYVQIPEEARRIHLMSKLHSCNNNNLDYKCNYLPTNQYCNWKRLRMAVRATRCCEMMKNLGCCQKPDQICAGSGKGRWTGRRRLSRNMIRGGPGRGQSKSGGSRERGGVGYDDGYNMKKDFVGGGSSGGARGGGPLGRQGASGGFVANEGETGGRSGFAGGYAGGQGGGASVAGTSGYGNVGGERNAGNVGPGGVYSGGNAAPGGGYSGGNAAPGGGYIGGNAGAGGYSGGNAVPGSVYSGGNAAPGSYSGGGGGGMSKGPDGVFKGEFAANDPNNNLTGGFSGFGPNQSSVGKDQSGSFYGSGSGPQNDKTVYSNNFGAGGPASAGNMFGGATQNAPGFGGYSEEDPSRFKTLERVPKQANDFYGNVGGLGRNANDERTPGNFDTGVPGGGGLASFFGGTSGFNNFDDSGRLKTLENVPRQNNDFLGSGGLGSNNFDESIPGMGMPGTGGFGGSPFDDIDNSGKLKTLERVSRQNNDFYGSGGGVGGNNNNDNLFNNFDDNNRLKTMERVPRQNNDFYGAGGPTGSSPGDVMSGFDGNVGDDPFGRLRNLERVPRQTTDFYGAGGPTGSNPGDVLGAFDGGPGDDAFGRLRNLERVPRQTSDFYGAGGPTGQRTDDGLGLSSLGGFDDDNAFGRLRTLERVARQTNDFYGTGGSYGANNDNNIFKASLDEPHSGFKPLEKVPRQTLDLPPKKDNRGQDRDPDELFRYYKERAEEWRKNNPQEDPPQKPKRKPKKQLAKQDSSDSFILVKTTRTVRKSIADLGDDEEGEGEPKNE